MMAVERGGEVTGSGYISKVELTGIANGFKVERTDSKDSHSLGVFTTYQGRLW